MRGLLPDSHEVEIAHPICDRCGAPMWLTRIESDEPGRDRHTFECKACGNMIIDFSENK